MKEAVIGAMMVITLYGIYFICYLIWKGLKKGTKTIVNKSQEVNLLTIYNIGRETMSNQQEYICGRDESPETCFLCEQEGKDHCMICADRFTLEEYKTIQKEGQTF